MRYMAHLPNLIIVGVVAGRDLQCPRAKLSVHIFVSNDGYQPAGMRACLGKITCGIDALLLRQRTKRDMQLPYDVTPHECNMCQAAMHV